MRNSMRGFTLLEVIIAMGIMAFLSVFTVQAIQRALTTKAKVQKDIDKQTTLRDALRIMERDINMAFNYRDTSIDLYNQAQEIRKKAKAGGGVSGGATPPLDPTEYAPKVDKIMTKFIGDTESIDFTSLSNVRVMEDSQISSQAEIGYKIKSCRRRTTQEQSSRCLWRRISNYIHEDITKEGQETVLLENITDFKLRYLGPGKDGEWVTQWSSGEGGDDVTKNKFPYAVEITIEMRDPSPDAKDKSLRMTQVASIRNPNNKKEEPPVDPNAPPVQ
jgi:prepilin-type N-terminal cleavage/methylation domain-containing protein